MTATVRLAGADDAAPVVAIHGQQESGILPLTSDHWLAAAPDSICLVAIDEDAVVGYVRAEPAWWTGMTDCKLVELQVGAAQAGLTVRTTLFDALLARLRAQGTRRLLQWVREDRPTAQLFAEHRGFGATGKIMQDFMLELARAPHESIEALDARGAQKGLIVKRLSDIPFDDGFLQALQRISSGSSTPGEPIAEWRRHVIDAPGLDTRWHWVALDGTQPVGITYLKRAGTRDAENDFTAVLPAYRGRGIARLLKLHAIEWARVEGILHFYTSSEIENHAMIAVNSGLGYLPGVRRIEMAAQLD